MKILILIFAMSFIAACSTQHELPIETTKEVQKPIVKTTSACSEQGTCK